MRSYKSINVFVFSSFYCNLICFTAMFWTITAEATWSHWLSIFVSTAIDSVNVVISRESFEHELTWMAFKNITWGPTLSEKDWYLCTRDECIRRDTCQRFLPKTRASSRPQFPRSKHGTPGTMRPLLARKSVAFYDSGFPDMEARVINDYEPKSSLKSF